MLSSGFTSKNSKLLKIKDLEASLGELNPLEGLKKCEFRIDATVLQQLTALPHSY